MLEQFSRWLLHQSIEMKTIPEGAPRQTFGSVVSELMSVYEAGAAVWMINKKTAAVRVRDAKYDRENQLLFLLLTYADTNIADPAFSNLETGELRIEEKLDGEGVAVSAHVVIDLVDRKGAPFINNAIVEDVPGLGRSKIEPFLTYLFRRGAKLECEDDEGGVMRFRPSVEMSGRLGETLRNDISTGKLSGVELIRFHEESDKLDVDPILVVDKAILKLRVAEDLGGRSPIDVLNGLLPKAKKAGYTDIRVKWLKATGKSKSSEFGTAREDAGDVLTFKTDNITVDQSLAQCEDRLRGDVADKLRELILDVRRQDGSD